MSEIPIRNLSDFSTTCARVISYVYTPCVKILDNWSRFTSFFYVFSVIYPKHTKLNNTVNLKINNFIETK